MRTHDDIQELRVAPELLAKWALETRHEAQVATYRALAFLARTEHAAVTLLPVPELLLSETAVQDPDGFLRLARCAGRAILGARPLLEQLEQAGLPVDRARAAKGFARRLEEAISELSGKRVLPAVLVTRLAEALRGQHAEATAEVAAAEGAASDESHDGGT